MTQHAAPAWPLQDGVGEADTATTVRTHSIPGALDRAGGAAATASRGAPPPSVLRPRSRQGSGGLDAGLRHGLLHDPPTDADEWCRSADLDDKRGASWRLETNGRAPYVPVVRARSGYWG